MNRYKQYYKQIICEDLILKQNYKHIFELPEFKKIVVNTTSKNYVQEKKEILPSLLVNELLCGQKAKLTIARKSIATFKLRQDQIIGYKTTLRARNMYRFLDLFLSVALPKLRDFHGISLKSLDKSGNLSLGLQNLMIFPELENNFEFFQTIKGIHLNFVVNAKSREQACLLYSAFQFPEISHS